MTAYNELHPIESALTVGLSAVSAFQNLIKENEDAILRLVTKSQNFANSFAELIASISPETKQQLIEYAKALEYYEEIGWELVVEITMLKYFYFQGDKDAIYAWEALSIANRYQTPLPLWAAWGVASVAESLTNIDTSKGKLESSLKQALKIDGHSVKRIKKHDKIYTAYSEFRNRSKIGAQTETDILNDLEKEINISRQTLMKEFKKLNKLFAMEEGISSPFSKEW